MLKVFFVTVLLICFLFAFVFGYMVNFNNFIKCDFNAPYKAEVLTGVGVIVFPIGALNGFIKIQGNNK